MDRVITRSEIADRARQHLGHREVTPNSSPLIDAWLRACGVRPGLAWCAAFASWCIGLAKACAGAVKLGRMFPETRNPQVGDLMWFPTDAKGAGHVGIVVAAVGLDYVLCIEGNSNDGVRYVLRVRSEVRFSSTCADALPLPDGSAIPAPLVHVSREGTR